LDGNKNGQTKAYFRKKGFKEKMRLELGLTVSEN
jgi:hypothetical protein